MEILKAIFDVVRDFLSKFSTTELALIPVFVTFLVFVLDKRGELKLRKQEVKREEYRKFLSFYAKLYDNTKTTQRKLKDIKQEGFFDLGASLLMYGSKKLYKQYLFFRLFSSDPVIKFCKFYQDDLLLYILADMFKTMRKEVGLNRLNNLSSTETLAFFVNDIWNNSEFELKANEYKVRIFLIRIERFFIKLRYIKVFKLFWNVVLFPVFGFFAVLGRHLIVLPIGRLLKGKEAEIEALYEKLQAKSNN